MRARPVREYTIVDDIKINSKLTSGEDVATSAARCSPTSPGRTPPPAEARAGEGFTPDQRFFIGLAQWACENQRPENLRVNAITNPHSPGRYRINGVRVEPAAVQGCVQMRRRRADGEQEDVQGVVRGARPLPHQITSP